MTQDLTAARLRELLSYDPDTGQFIWLVKRGKARLGMSAGTNHVRGYRCIFIQGKNYLAHRLAWLWVHGAWPDQQIDHINGDRLDNRMANLRQVTNAINSQNRRRANKNNSSGRLGVSQNANGFLSLIRIDGNLIRIGLYETADEAHAAYLQAKRQHHAGCTI
jgi:hypothetical protein